MADIASKSLDSILHSDEYERVENIPVFDAHQEFSPDGTLLRDFTPEKLAIIAKTCNARLNTGDLAPIGPGHTVSDMYGKDGQIVYKAKETDNPPLWGFLTGFRVGKYGPSGKTAILVDAYMRKNIILEGKTISGKQALAEFPRRSIELWY